ncbi:MAG: hypothetical protein ACXVXP_00400 [Mycobacteriaceae bacterium]
MPSTNWQRWLPTNPALLSGALASGVVFALNQFGVHVLPSDVELALTPLISFLTAAVVHKATPTVTPAPTRDPVSVERDTLGGLLAQEVQARLDREPAFVDEMVLTAVRLLAVPLPAATPAPAAPDPGVQHGTGPNPYSVASFLAPASTNAPHNTQ